ncbi:MAG: hypothetical protein U1E37_04900 [Sphingomonadaceae bacterium]|jgi:hypothetical protein
MPTPIQNPAGYAVNRAVAFADADGSMLPVTADTPLPVALRIAPVTALAGTAAMTSLVGPYQPVPGRAVMLTLSGTWTGTVRVVRSADGGATRQPLTIAGNAWAQFSANACEPVWDESESAATLYLEIALSAGSVTYRMAQ